MKRLPKINTYQQLEKLLEEQKRKVARDVSPFKKDNPAKQQRRIKKAKRDRFYFYKTYLPHYFTEQPNWHHEEIDEHCEIRNSITLVQGARETGKTVQVAIGYALHQGVFEHRKHIVFVGHTEDLAAERLIAIRAEVESNPRLIHDFGDLRNPGLWEMDDFTFKTGTRYKAFGYRGYIRGLISGPFRPDLAIIEDFENKQTARNIRISLEKKEHLLEEVYPIMKNGNMIWLSNMPGKKCAAAIFNEETLADKSSQGKRFVLFYPLEYDQHPGKYGRRNGKTKIDPAAIKTRLLWSKIKDREYCDNLKRTIGTIAYEREYRLNPIVEGKIFQEEWFREISDHGRLQKSIIYIDPSFGKSKHAAKKAIILLGWTGTRYQTRDGWIRQASTTEMVEALYAMWTRWKGADVNLISCHCEANYGQLDRLKQDLDAAAERHGFRIPILPYENKTDKDVRIEGCAGIIERGDAEFDFSNPDLRELRDQFVYFPDHPFKDGPDAWESAKAILDASAANWDFKTVVKRTFQRARMAV